MNKLIFALLFAVCILCGQTQVNVVDAPGADEHSRRSFDTTAGSDLVTYVCHARSFGQPAGTLSTVTYSAISNANPAVVTATGHGFNLHSSPTVVITGGTGNWAAFNGTVKATVVNDNSFSIPINTSAFGAVTGTIVIKSNAPSETAAMWKVQKVVTDSDGKNAKSFWSYNGYNNKCSDRESLSYH
jgi:hypothetical protein